MPDIFISYSRKDSEHALALAERLRAEGMNVWIDQQGIRGAEKWTTEIVEGIRACSTFIVLLSPNSVESEHVLRELSLALEKRKRVLPVDLLPAELPSSFEYPLAGVQRVAISDFNAILRAHKYGVERIVAKDTRKSLMILPFEDLSPGHDNGWFADGIVSETISVLGNVKALRLIDWNTSREFRTHTVSTATLAKELEVRYFLEGQVRKAGANIKISVSLLDFETGDHLWQESLKGTMDDVFDIQEKVAGKVVEGFKIHLASGEKKKLAERETENAEAYELVLKANEYQLRHTREDYQLAAQQYEAAYLLDSGYANAIQGRAFILAEIYRKYDRDPHILIEAEALARRALEIKPHLWKVYSALSNVLRLQGHPAEAEEAAKEYVRRAPEDNISHFSLGFYYDEMNQPAMAISPYEKAIELRPDSLAAYWNLILVADRLHDSARVERWSRAALPHFEKRLRLVPDDDDARVEYANLFERAGARERAIEALYPLREKQNLDGSSIYNIGCLYARLGDASNALMSLRRAVAAGFTSVEVFRTDPDLDCLRGLPEFQELITK